MRYFFSLLCIITFFISCSPKNKHTSLTISQCSSGHILFIYVGDLDHPIEPLILHTPNDTTYLQYKGRDPESVFWIFNSDIGYLKENIDIINTTLYSEIKNKVLEYDNKNNTDSSFYFQIIVVDGCDSVSAKIYNGDYAFSFFSELDSLTRKHNLEHATTSLEYYKEMQLQYNH